MLFSFGGESDTAIGVPINIKTDSAGNIFIHDTGERCIKMFSKDKKLIRKFGRPGNGPGEFSVLYDFAIARNGNIYALDRNKICIIGGKDVTEYHLKSNIFATKITLLDNERILLQSTPIYNNDIICEYDISSDKVLPMEKFYSINNPDNYGPGSLFIGKIHPWKDGYIYIPNFFNMIYYFKGTKIVNTITTIDNITHPAISVIIDGNSKYMPARHLYKIESNADSYIINDSLYILSAPANKKYKVITYDVFSAQDGKYIHTIQTNIIEDIIMTHFTGDRIYVINEKGIINVYGK